jgi:succinate-semialdehyde dehydrogenase/glutarate-semialdehyde dehydrogenase
VSGLPSERNFVRGEWVEAVDGRTMAVVNPATGAEIGRVPEGGAADVDRAVRAAQGPGPRS